MTTNCSSFVAIASGGYEQVTAQSTLEDGTTVDIVQDTERFYLLDAAGYLWILNLYALEKRWLWLLHHRPALNRPGR